jgi:hypothetical protein
MPAVRGSLPPAWRRLAAETAWNNENERLQRLIENNNARYQRALAEIQKDEQWRRALTLPISPEREDRQMSIEDEMNGPPAGRLTGQLQMMHSETSTNQPLEEVSMVDQYIDENAPAVETQRCAWIDPETGKRHLVRAFPRSGQAGANRRALHRRQKDLADLSIQSSCACSKRNGRRGRSGSRKSLLSRAR